MNRIHIPCPFCEFRRILDADQKTKTEAIEETRMPYNWQPDFFVKCAKCGRQIAIKKVG